MALTNTGEILKAQRFALAVNVITLEQAEAFIEAGAKAQSGLILQLSENTVKFHGSITPVGSALLAMARESSWPISIHLDHATDEKLVRAAVDLGFSSVMFDGSTLDYQQNLTKTAELAEFAHNHGVWFEAELGEIGGKDGVHAPGVRTKPSEAKQFVQETGVDGLAVAVGSSHAMLEKSASLDFELISELARTVSIPLVLHGSSGVSRSDLKRAIASGISKVNLATELNVVFNKSLVESLDQLNLGDPRKFLGPARSALTAYLAELISELS